MSGYNKFLRSLVKSNTKPVETVVKGTIPNWLNGSLYRNGPGRFQFGDKSYDHLFDGQACVHKFKIEDSKVFYSNKLLETESYKRTLNENRLYPGFGTNDLASNIFGRYKTFFTSLETSDNVNVNVAPFANEQLYALTETTRMCRLDPSSLDIIETPNLLNHIPSIKNIIAHPHIENDGTWITAGLSSKNRKVHYEFIRFKGGEQEAAKSANPCENAQVIALIPSSHSDGFSYFHSFAVTKNYIIFLEQPLKLNFKLYFQAFLKNKPKSSALMIEKSFPTRIHVINKQTGEVWPQKFYTDSQFTFHHINAFERTDSLVVDLNSYDTANFDINAFTFENMYSGKLMNTNQLKATAKRIEIPTDFNKKSISSDEIYCKLSHLNPNLAFELPMINYNRHNGLPYKFVYGANHFTNPFSIIKMNVDNPLEVLKIVYEEEGKDFLPSEPIFVESPNAQSEDDGVVLVMVLAEQNDFLSILDAKTLKEIARASIPEDVKGAFTFHGFFADNRSFSRMKA